MSSEISTVSVLFVCLGNICRSPAAEGVFTALVRERDLERRIRVDSAGTLGYHAGNRADPQMIRVASERGYELLSRARQVTPADLVDFDWVIAMDERNFIDLKNLHPNPKNQPRLLSDFLDLRVWPRSVPDPYQLDDSRFHYVLDMLEAALPNLLQEIMNSSIDS